MKGVLPLAIGPANCEATLGVTWRWLRDHAEGLGLAVTRVEGKSFVDAAAAWAAIQAHGRPHEETVPDELAILRAQLGKRRKAG